MNCNSCNTTVMKGITHRCMINNCEVIIHINENLEGEITYFYYLNYNIFNAAVRCYAHNYHNQGLMSCQLEFYKINSFAIAEIFDLDYEILNCEGAVMALEKYKKLVIFK